MDAPVKTCRSCGEAKSLDAFYRHKAMKDGHLSYCKPCVKSRVRKYRNDNIERIREYDRERGQLPHRKALRQQIFRDYVSDHPDRQKAHNAVSNAVRDGRLTKEPCSFCGSEDRLEAHHHDYSRPLDVTWLCKTCHRKFHGLERIATYRDDSLRGAGGSNKSPGEAA